MGQKFFALLGSIPARFFDSSSVLNLANFAEELGATAIYLITDRNHPEQSWFRKIFRIIDAIRISVYKDECLNKLLKSDFMTHTEMEFFKMSLE